MLSNVIEILLGDALIFRLRLATIVAIEGSPEHVPFCIRIISALLSEFHINFVYSDAEVLKLLAVNPFIAACDLVPRVVYFLLVSFSCFSAALFFGFAHLAHEIFMSLLLSIGEFLLPFPHVFLQCFEEFFLALDFFF